MPARGDSSASFNDQVGECLDYSDLDKVVESTHVFNPDYAWASEYFNFRSEDDEGDAGGDMTVAAPALVRPSRALTGRRKCLRQRLSLRLNRSHSRRPPTAMTF